jgi:hypothetical protein
VKTQPKKWPESRQRKAANVINAALRKLILAHGSGPLVRKGNVGDVRGEVRPDYSDRNDDGKGEQDFAIIIVLSRGAPRFSVDFYYRCICSPTSRTFSPQMPDKQDAN